MCGLHTDGTKLLPTYVSVGNMLFGIAVLVAHAGVAVSSMMFGTTVLTYMVMLMIWETNFFLATAFLICFGFIDMVYTTGT